MAFEIDEIDQLKKLEPFFDHIFRSFDPKEFITKLSAFDRGLYGKYFRGYRINRFNRPKLAAIASKEVLENDNRLLAQFMSILWNREQRKLYNAMLDEVKKINEDVEAIEAITDEQAAAIVAALDEQGWERIDVLVCVRLNGVRFSEAYIEEQLQPSVEPAEP